MLSQNIINLAASNRGSEKPAVPLTLISQKIQIQLYQKLISSTIELCTALELQLTTKYLSRGLLDQTILACPADQLMEYYFKLAIACISVAIKLTEPRQLSEKLTTQQLYQLAQLPVSTQQSLQLSLKVSRALGFRLLFTTPFQYYEVFFHSLPWFRNLEVAFNFVIEFALLLPELCEYSAEQLFFGGVLAIFDYKQVVLNDLQQKILGSMNGDWPRIKALSSLILESLHKATQD